MKKNRKKVKIKYKNFNERPSNNWLKKLRKPLISPLKPVPLDQPAINVFGNNLKYAIIADSPNA